MVRKPIEVEEGKERVVIVGLFPKSDMLDDVMMDELEALCETAGGEVVGRVIQRRDTIDPTYYVGGGKVEEVKQVVEENRADVVVFNGDLAPAQARNLEEALGARVVDRTELILDIFARHAKSKQAKIQVELAQLEYLLPRLRHRWTHLERITGGIGLRGPGEKQLEEDKRAIRNRITELKREIKTIEKHRQRIVESRKHFQVCLVGYTNAGKTTLMNRLTGAQEYVSRKLFSTLDTRTRLWHLPDGKEVLLSDTVGFIRDIPHHLVASFQATLEEVISADLLLHIVDASDPAAEIMIQTVENVLKELHAEHIMRILLLNKVDNIKNMLELTLLKRRMQDALPISARTGEGLDRLSEMVSKAIEQNWRTVKITVSAQDWETVAGIERWGRLIERHFRNEKVYYKVQLPLGFLSKIVKNDGVKVSFEFKKEEKG